MLRIQELMEEEITMIKWSEKASGRKRNLK